MVRVDCNEHVLFEMGPNLLLMKEQDNRDEIAG